MKIKFSVVVPAFNEAEFIGPAVKTLEKQTVPRNSYEIIVVDNNSTDDTAKIARKAGADKVVHESQPGTNFARQRGVLESEGEIVAFLDADSEPIPEWLEKIGKDLEKPGASGVSGPYDYGFRNSFIRVLDRLYARFILVHLDQILFFVFRRKAGMIFGGNFAAWRWAIDKIGGLPPLKFWGDDGATAMLLSRKAGRVIFDPELIVKSSPRRFEKDGMLSLLFRYIRAYLKVYFRSEGSYTELNQQKK